nr:SDR family oxidoreductase [Maliibacterium massiliense]
MNPNPFDLSGKRAIVTGAAGGLSLGMATGLHEAGATLVLIDKQDKVQEAASALSTPDAPAYAIVADLRIREDLNDAFSQAVEYLGGGVDILINGAGTQARHPSEAFPVEEWDDVLEVNLNAVFQMCQLAGRLMLRQGYGKIVNVASMLSYFGGFTVPAYAASKGGVAQLTKALSNEWVGRGVHVNAVAPGYMDTDMNIGLRPENNPVRYEEITKRIPAGRWGTPDDMKYIAVFLSSRASDYISGAIIPVDGGYLER